MDYQKTVRSNVDRLDAIIKQLQEAQTEMLGVKDVNGGTLKRALADYDALGKAISSIALLKHDLRDDYGNAYVITKGET
jgi:SNF2 family DNA or RNA helicase